MLIALLLISLTIVAYDLTKGAADYKAFKRFEDTDRRQRMLRNWLVQSLVLYGVAGLSGLALLNQLGVLSQVPDPFRSVLRLRSMLGTSEPTAAADQHESWLSLTSILIVGFVAGITVTAVTLMVRRRLSANAGSSPPPRAGDFTALIPRNSAERRWAFLLSLNAGLSEEIFFRAWLPVLLYALCHNAIVSLTIAAILFGAMHAYQGLKGVLATTVLGAAFTYIYVSSGQIWIAMILHALIDLNSLIVQPMLTAQTPRT
jgi:uncharacterized protein